MVELPSNNDRTKMCQMLNKLPLGTLKFQRKENQLTDALLGCLLTNRGLRSRKVASERSRLRPVIWCGGGCKIRALLFRNLDALRIPSSLPL